MTGKALVPVVVEQPRELAKKSSQRFEPESLSELMRYAEFVVAAECVPKGRKGKLPHPADIVVAVQMGATVGLNCGQSLQNICVINGHANIWGDALIALCLAHPDCIDILEDDLKTIEENGSATCIAKRNGRQDKTCTYTIADAKRANLWGKAGVWTANPYRMLQMRARGFACRDQFPDAIRGLGITEISMGDDEVLTKPSTVLNAVPDKSKPTEHPTESPQTSREMKTANILIMQIQQAKTPEALEGIAVLAKDLDDAIKEPVREAYKAKIEELKQNALKDSQPN